MNYFIFACALAFAFTNAEPVGYGSGYSTIKTTDPDVEIIQVEVMEIPWQEEPQEAPQQGYGPPKQEYGPPKPVYGPPPEPTTTEADLTTTEYPTTTGGPGNSTISNRTRSGKLKDDGSTERGAYYIYHPNGVLQKVVYATKDDVKNMAYSAQLKYQNVEPIKEPIYSYDPETYIFQRINK